MTPDESSLPALRGSGLTLYRDRRARKIVNGWDNAKDQDDQHTAGTELDLFAEDVTRGYRLDVAEISEPDTWFSLQARVGAYALRTAVPGERLALPVAEPIRPDEGYVKAASASHNAAEPDVAYIHGRSSAGRAGAWPRPARETGSASTGSNHPTIRLGSRRDSPCRWRSPSAPSPAVCRDFDSAARTGCGPGWSTWRAGRYHRTSWIRTTSPRSPPSSAGTRCRHQPWFPGARSPRANRCCGW